MSFVKRAAFLIPLGAAPLVASAQTFTVPTGVDATAISATLWTGSGAWMIGFGAAAVVFGVVMAFIKGFKGKAKGIAR